MQTKKVGREDLEAFETAYNAACAFIARGDLGQGEVLLKRARGERDTNSYRRSSDLIRYFRSVRFVR